MFLLLSKDFHFVLNAMIQWIRSEKQRNRASYTSEKNKYIYTSWQTLRIRPNSPLLCEDYNAVIYQRREAACCGSWNYLFHIHQCQWIVSGIVLCCVVTKMVVSFRFLIFLCIMYCVIYCIERDKLRLMMRYALYRGILYMGIKFY